MTADELKNFTRIINSYNETEYLFSTIICAAAPTLAGEKASSLLNFGCNNRNLQLSWKNNRKYINDILNISFAELKEEKKCSLVLFYNKEKLENIIKEKRNIKFLERYGYDRNMNIEQYLAHLKGRFEGKFPHEIGIFLGYPLEDVAAFIDNPERKCKITGYWKVYHDAEAAKNIFRRYDDIKYDVFKLMLKGVKPIDIFNLILI